MNRKQGQLPVGAWAQVLYVAFLFTFLLGTVAATSLTTVFNTLGIQSTADDLVADTWKVFHTTATNKHDGVLLEVVAFTWNVGGNFDNTGQADTCDFTKSGVRFHRGRGGHTSAHAAAQWTCDNSRRDRSLGH